MNGKLVLRLFLIASLLNFLVSCNSHKVDIDRAFYYWKSSAYSLENDELSCLKNQKVQKLYVKFFEVDLDTILGPVPTSKTSLHIWNYTYNSEKDSMLTNTMKNLEVIPTVFIKNKTLYGLSKGCIDTLADNILFLTNKYYKNLIRNTQQDFKEIQLDCDWTEKTKENYFYLLQTIKKASKKTISCTLRLYPYKNRDKLGVPPADKAVLMCYNLVNPLASEDKNSILSNKELKKYLRKSDDKYPIHLDIALPVFSWMQVYQNNQFVGIINPKSHELDSILKPVKPLWHEITRDMEYRDLYLRIGDKIKIEDVTAKTIQDAISSIRTNITFDSRPTIILFHLDANNINKYDHETLSSFYTDFIK